MSEDTSAPEVEVQVDPEPPTPEQIAEAQAADAAADAARKPLDVLKTSLQQLRNYKAFHLAKVESVVSKIESVGGEVPASLKEVLDQIRTEAK
jgi:hypothetical protein